MSRKGLERQRLIVELATPWVRGLVVDMGCDHGHTTRALQDLGTAELVVGSERRSNRLPRRADLCLVVADKLAPFRRVDLAVITGMGPHVILEALKARPEVAVVHSPDRCDTLRRGLAAQGWRIDAEGLAREGRGFAEVIRVLPGEETATGLALAFGPRLLEDPLLAEHKAHQRRHWARVAERAPPGSAGHQRAADWLRFLDDLPS